jgi:microcystin-dependent protein
MSNPYVGEVRLFGGNFAPAGWAFCDGSLLPISEYDVLFNLIGTTYGGDGQTTFALPDLRGRLPVHQGASYVIGQAGGVESVALSVNQLPAHTHAAAASASAGTGPAPGNAIWAATSTDPLYGPGPATGSAMAPAVQPVGGGQPHDNLMPYLCVSFIICLFGIYPSPS